MKILTSNSLSIYLISQLLIKYILCHLFLRHFHFSSPSLVSRQYSLVGSMLGSVDSGGRTSSYSMLSLLPRAIVCEEWISQIRSDSQPAGLLDSSSRWRRSDSYVVRRMMVMLVWAMSHSLQVVLASSRRLSVVLRSTARISSILPSQMRSPARTTSSRRWVRGLGRLFARVDIFIFSWFSVEEY